MVRGKTTGQAVLHVRLKKKEHKKKIILELSKNASLLFDLCLLESVMTGGDNELGVD